MAIQVEHPLHARRRGRNLGLLLILVGLVAIVFALTVVKVLQLGDARAFEAYDHVARPQIVTGATEPDPAADPAPAQEE